MKQNNRLVYFRTIGCALLVFGITLVLGGCAASKQARSVATSGFLSDYSQLKPGG